MFIRNYEREIGLVLVGIGEWWNIMREEVVVRECFVELSGGI